MSQNLPCELKNWLFSLGFRPKNMSSEKIEEEFQRLTPPEVRDIWRSILVHVVPVQQSRYIKKVLLLKELENYTSNNGSKPLIPENLKSINELRQFKNYEKLLKQLNNRYSCISDTKARTEETKKKIIDLVKKKEQLLKEKENINVILTLEMLKTKSYEESTDKFNEIHECLSYVCSFWNLSDKQYSSDDQCLEIIKLCLKKVNEFGKQRQHLNHINLINEQRSLLDSVIDLTGNVSPLNVQKTLISMLSDTLSFLLNMNDHLSTKEEHNSKRNLEKKLTELEKQSVQTFTETKILQKRVKNLQEHVQAQQTQLLLLLEKNIDDKVERRDLEIWLETEFLKQRMTTRQNYLIRKEEMIISYDVASSCPNFMNENEKEMFFKTIHEHQNHLDTLERDIRDNLCYLSDESIKLFLNYQSYCRNKITKFVEDGNLSKRLDVATKLIDSFKNEMALLNALYLNSSSKDVMMFKSATPSDTILHDIIECTKKCNFTEYLNHACNAFFEKVDRPHFNSDILNQKRLKIMNEENEFVMQLQKTLSEAKNNLKVAEEFAKTCAKHIELWNDFSVNDLISKKMVVADHTFVEWQERYYTIIRRLLKR